MSQKEFLQQFGICQVLDSDGRMCKKTAVNTIDYHGDHELYEYHFENSKKDKRWVRISVCKEHEHE